MMKHICGDYFYHICGDYFYHICGDCLYYRGAGMASAI